MSENDKIRELELRCKELEYIADLDLEEKYKYFLVEAEECYKTGLEKEQVEVLLSLMYQKAFKLAIDAIHHVSMLDAQGKIKY